MLVRLLLWNVLESKSSIAELRASMPELSAPSTWIWNEAAERFGAIVVDDDLPESIGWAQDLIGGEPDVYEEFEAG
jgi:hypothetical protein